MTEEIINTETPTPVEAPKRTKAEILAAAREAKRLKAEAGAKFPPPPKRLPIHPNELTHEEVWLRAYLAAMQTLQVKHPSNLKACGQYADIVMEEFSVKFDKKYKEFNGYNF